MKQQAATAVRTWLRLTHVRQFEGATRAVRAAQERKLRAILEANQDTVFGREHRFDQIRSIADYQLRIPIREYEALEPYVQRAACGERNVLTRQAPLLFAVTSGTTGRSKLIPVTPAYLAEYRHAVQIHTWRLIVDYPDVARGTCLVTSSCDVEGYTESGTPYGAISGFLTRRQPKIIQYWYALPHEVARVKDVEAKYYLTLLLAIQQDIRMALSVSPSTLVLLAERMQTCADRLIGDVARGQLPADLPVPEAAARAVRQRLRPNPARAQELSRLAERHGALHPRHVWPNLRVLSCWKGGTMPLYLQRLRRFWGDAPVRDFGYMASEGRGSIPLIDAGSAGPLAVTTHFFEFIPTDEIDRPSPTCLTADQLAPGQEYYVLFTTSGGLYRYHINDIVRVVDYYHQAPLIQFVRKGQGISSVTGEKLTEPQVTAGLLQAVESSGANLKHFSAAPRWSEPPYYALMTEEETPVAAGARRVFLRAMDESLCAANVEYRAKRESGRLGPPVLHVLAPGSFDRYRQERILQGAPEAQVKIPHLSPELEFGKQFSIVEQVQLGPDAIG
jgi:hypothetical protein